jgi:hypothetical protein
MHSKSAQQFFLICSSILILAPPAFAESIAIPPLPAPAESPPSGITVRRTPSATFTFADAKRIKTQSRTGRFQLVGLYLNETVDIAVQFPAMPSGSAPAQPLDGGNIISFSLNPVGAGGLAVIRFQAGNRPGLYRVLLSGLGGSALLQFWVSDPNNPGATGPNLPNRQ